MVFAHPYTGFALLTDNQIPSYKLGRLFEAKISEASEWCAEQFGPEQNRGLIPAPWFSRFYSIAIYDPVDAMAFALRWC